MKITIDASRLLTSTPTGVEVYCQQIIQGLLKQEHNLILYAPKLIKDLPTQNQKILAWPFGKLWSQLRLGFELLTHPPTIFFSPGYVIPWLALFNRQTRKIVTIHDVAFVYLPASYSFFQRWFLKLTTRQAVKYAHKIIVPTQATQNDLIQYFNCPANKIQVTHFGYQKTARQATGDSNKKQILYIGRLEDKKNIYNLIKAFKLFNKKYPSYKLILAGKPGVGFKKIKPLLVSGDSIDYRGYVSQADKVQLLSESSALVLLSKYEGFGFPLLEAFAAGLPVLASDLAVLREIGQDACLYVTPDDISAVAKKMEKIIINKALRQDLIQLGKQRLQHFSWQKCIWQTWQILKN